MGFGDALAGRGSALNDTIASLPALLGYLTPVARYLSDPRTQLTRFLRSLNRLMGTVAPVAPTFARLFTDMATTFAAIFERSERAGRDDRGVTLDTRGWDRVAAGAAAIPG